MAGVNGRNVEDHRRKLDVVFIRYVAIGIQRYSHRSRIVDFCTARDRSEIGFHHFQSLDLVDVAPNRECGVVRAVPTQEELLEIVQSRTIEVFEVSDGAPAVRVPFWICCFTDLLEDASIGLIVDALSALIFYRLALHLELLLGDGIEEVSHAIGFEPEHLLELIDRYGLVIVRAVAVGRAVQRSTGLRHDLEVLLVVDVLGSLEQHVLEEVGEARTSNVLAARAHVVGHVDMSYGITVIFVQDDGEAIVEHIFAVRNNDIVTIRLDGLHESEPLGNSLFCLYRCLN